MVSMFTATFCSRILFEIAERLKFVNLRMMDGVGFLKRILLGQGDLNFMSMSKLCLGVSVALTAVGLTAALIRGKGLLNIDFVGGTTVTIQLEQPVALEDMRRITQQILVDDQGKPIESTLVRVEKEPQNTVYTLVTSLNDENQLAERLHLGLAKNDVANLVTYKAKVTRLDASGNSHWQPPQRSVRLVSMRAEDGQDTTPAATDVSSSDGVAVVEVAPASTAVVDSQPTSEATSDGQSTGGSEATVTDAATATDAPAVEPEVRVSSKFRLELSGAVEKDSQGNDRNIARRNPTKLKQELVEAAQAVHVDLNPAFIRMSPNPRPAKWREDQNESFSTWDVELPVAEEAGAQIMQHVAEQIQSTPLWLSLSQIGGRVAGEMQQRALAALLVSLLFIVAYIWFRFQRISYGLAAVVALVHDVLITLGLIALCHWLARPLGFLMIEEFKIGLTEIAAFLTIIGYSLNDTIVIFDRVREIRGRSPRLTTEMLNTAVNQTLSRTLLTSSTTLLTVLLLYIFGGEGIHAFSFALLIGILVGTYSSIYIAAPVLLWLSEREAAAAIK
ncbi:MAG: protein translocase subunit SecF [Pirellulaceae bacterium]|nr:protein translocase subunit SecF [Pirellulaceae bacterium]